MKLLQIYNFAQHYRSAIFQLMDKELGCDFVFGDKMADIKKMDYSLLTHKVTEVHNIPFKHGYYQKGVPQLIRKDYDTYLILGESRCISTWLLLLSAKLYPRKRVFLWSHGWLGKENGIKKFITKIFYGLCDGAFIYNNRSRKLMIEGGIPEDKLTTIYNSLDYDKQLPIRNSIQTSSLYQDHFGNSNKTLIFIGRLTPVKQLHLIIEAVASLKAKGEYYNVVFVGDGTERQALEQLVDDRGLKDAVWFYGACYDEKENAELIYNADLCVSPGNIGLTAMHVMMFGCPAITNDDFNHQMPEFEAITDGVTGAFFKAGDSASLANAIERWFSDHHSNREAIRQACYKEIDTKWNPHNQIKILKDFLK